MLFSLNVHDAILVWLFIMPYCPDSSQCPFSIPTGNSASLPMSWFITRMMTWLYSQCCGLLPEWWHAFPHNVMVYFQADDMPSLPILRFISRLMICLPSPCYGLFPGWYAFHPHVMVYFQADDMPSLPLLWFISQTGDMDFSWYLISLAGDMDSPWCLISHTGDMDSPWYLISLAGDMDSPLVSDIPGWWYPWLVTWIPLGVWYPWLVRHVSWVCVLSCIHKTWLCTSV